jgi:RecA-family ATPase
VRGENINRLYGCRFGELEQVRWLPRLGYDSLLMTFDRSDRGVLTPFFEQVRQAALGLQAQLVIIDTAADTFGGNEIIRSQVRQFIQAALGRLARELNGAVLLCAHPSVAGLTTGSGTGGSTGWSNTVRSRLYLERPKPDSDEEESAAPDDSRRILTRKKANMASTGDSVELRWENGVFVTVGERIDSFTAGPIGGMVRARAERVFLLLLDAVTAEGRYVTDAPNSPYYAPNAFAKRPKREGLRPGDFAAAMERLFANGAIRAATFKDGNREPRRRIERCR